MSQKIEASGHPSIESRGRYIITDQFNKAGGGNWTVSLRLIDVKADKEEIVCTIPTMPRINGEMNIVYRLDGHPVWSRGYKKLSLQAAHEGKRQLFLVDLTKLIG